MSEITAKDIVSSVFRKNEGKFLSPEEIRDECAILSKALDEKNPGDPGRTARTFSEEGFLKKNSASYYCYNPSMISDSLVQKFSQFQYLYDKLPKNFKPTAFIKIPLGKVPENVNTVDFISSEIEKYKSNYGTHGIHYCILKYALELTGKNVSNKDLCEKSKISDSYTSEISKMKSVFDIIKQRNEITYDCDKIETKTHFQSESSYTSHFSQTIYYGVPGSGKSHEIDEITKGLSEEQKMRVVFHPEYTNADFVGQILPSLNEDDGKIDYKFKPGPFTKILRRAYLNPSKKYFLIIEEINRGNAAAIFGDLFQLLDRISESSSGEKIGNNSYGTGWSSYFVSNDSINTYIREYADSSIYSDVEKCVVIPDENKNKDKISEKYSTVKIGDLTFTANTGIRLPPNLSILATMNTSDQNVFTLDNAFQRRWNMVLVKNEFKPESENQREAKIAGSNVSWEDFHKKINAEISKLSIENNLSSMVDKRLGCWFAKAKKNEDDRFEIKKDDFENKILKYLWDDAFKFNREFFEPVENFEELLAKIDLKAENFGVFRNLKFDENKKDSSNKTGENEQN